MNAFKTLFIVLMMLFGYASVIRNLKLQRKKEIITQHQVTIIVTAYLGYLTLTIIFFARHPTILFIMGMAPLFIMFMYQIYFKKTFESRLQQQFWEFLNRVILNMKSGHSFRKAFSAAAEISPTYARKKLLEMYEFVSFSQQSINSESKLFSEWIEIFRKADGQSLFALDFLDMQRRRIGSQRDFRHKSGLAATQARIQVGILSIIYVGLLILLGANGMLKGNHILILISLLLFVIGNALILILGKKRKWKI
jgi:amino acid transporter